MKSIFGWMQAIPSDVILNCILVSENVRPAMMVQWVDYNEMDSSGEKTRKIKTWISREFPQLHISEQEQGVLVSREKYEDNEIMMDDYGRVLGYPCEAEFNDILNDRPDVYWVLHLKAELESGEVVYLMTNMCKLNTPMVRKFEKIWENASRVLTTEGKYDRFIRMCGGVDRVRLEKEKKRSLDKLLEILINESDNLTDVDLVNNVDQELISVNALPELTEYSPQLRLTDPFVRGMVVMMLLDAKYDRTAPLYPLQSLGEEKMNEIMEMMTMRRNVVVDILTDREGKDDHSSTRMSRGGGRRSRRRGGKRQK